jgi:hypothetical protein
MRLTTYAIFVLFLVIDLFPTFSLAVPAPITIPRLGKAAAPGNHKVIECVPDFYRLIDKSVNIESNASHHGTSARSATTHDANFALRES